MKALTITGAELSERSGLPTETISRYRKGKNRPGVKNLAALCIGLRLSKVNADCLFDLCGRKLGNTLEDKIYGYYLGICSCQPLQITFEDCMNEIERITALQDQKG